MKTLTISVIVLILALFSTNICSQFQWQVIQGGLPSYHYLNDIKKADQDNLVMAGFQGIYKSTNRGSNWTQVHNSINFKKISMYGDFGLAVSDYMYKTVRTTDGGNSWFTVHEYTATNTGSCISLQMINENVAYKISYFSYSTYSWHYLEKTTNGGSNWSAILSTTNSTAISGFYFLNESTGYASFDSQFCKTIDGGSSWTVLSSGSYMEINRLNSNNMFAIKNGKLVKSTDEGLSWNILLNENIWNYNAIDPNFIVTVAYSGTIKRTINGGAAWIQDVSGVTSPLSSVAIIDNNTAVAVGNNGTILKYDNLTGSNSTTNEVPDGYELSQNYPNPFNPSTKISFSLPKSSFVKMVVYDVTGKEAASLVNENLNSGTYEVDFNASKLTSGVYFCRITAGGFTDVKKMILAK